MVMLKTTLNERKKVRAAAKKLNKYVAILGDLQGPKNTRFSLYRFQLVGINHWPKHLHLIAPRLDVNAGTNETVGIWLQSPTRRHVSEGDLLLLDDVEFSSWSIVLKVEKWLLTVTVGGKLSNNKGINRQGGGLTAEALTEKG